MHLQELQDSINTAYIQSKYQSFPIAYSHPNNLATSAYLFGFDVSDIITARILEIGCASGENILPLAFSYPNAEFVAFDIVEEYIQEAKKKAQYLNLKNIQLLMLDLKEANAEKLGKFDYIIVHGVFSWIPLELQDVLLKNVKNMLNDNGLAYISYNVYPGWHYNQIIRDALLFAMKSSNSDNIVEKNQYAKKIIKFLQENSKDKFMQCSLDIVKDKLNETNGYLEHDHLSICNYPIYFSDFCAKAEKHDLGYVSEAQVSSMFYKVAQESLPTWDLFVKNRIDLEQSLDFLHARSFRTTILSHTVNANKISGHMQSDRVRNLYFNLEVITTEEGGITKLNISTQEKQTQELINLPAHVCLALQIIGDVYPNYISYQNIIDKFHSQENVNLSEEQELEILGFFTIMIQLNKINFALFSYNISKVSLKPKIYEYARQSLICNPQLRFLTSINHYKIKLCDFGAKIIPFLDGINTVDDICPILYKQLQQESFPDLSPSVDEFKQQIQDKIKIMAKNFLFEQ